MLLRLAARLLRGVRGRDKPAGHKATVARLAAVQLAEARVAVGEGWTRADNGTGAVCAACGGEGGWGAAASAA